MKRILSCAAAAVLLMQSLPLHAAAEDTPVPADLEQAVLDQLTEEDAQRSQYGEPQYDTNRDGVITDAELAAVEHLSLELDGVTSLECISKFTNLKTLWLRGGEISDLSPLSSCKSLVTLGLSKMAAVTDISFAKKLDLRMFYISDMDQITDEQKLDILKFHNLETVEGGSGVIGATPCNLFERDQIELTIADEEIACFSQNGGNYANFTAYPAYARKYGNTTYTLSYQGQILRTGSIKVKARLTDLLDLNPDAPQPELFWSYHYAYESRVVLNQDRLLRMTADGPELIADHVKAFNRGSMYGTTKTFVYSDFILYEDGTVTVGGQTPVMPDPDIRFEKMRGNLLFTPEHALYICREDQGRFYLEHIGEGYKDTVQENTSYLCRDDGEVDLLSVLRTETADGIKLDYQLTPTGIWNVISSKNDYFVDDSNVLWKVEHRANQPLSVTRRAKNVEFVGYRDYDGNTYGCVYITTDGSAYAVETGRRVSLNPPDTTEKAYQDGDSFWEGMGTYESAYVPENYHLTNDGVLVMEQNGKYAAVADVREFVTAVGDPDSDHVAAYFILTDGTLWYYSFREKQFYPADAPREKPPVTLPDFNGDGKTDKKDVQMLVNALMNKEGAAVPEAADLDGNQVVDARDLTLLKRVMPE